MACKIVHLFIQAFVQTRQTKCSCCRYHLSDPDNINAVDQAVVQAICERKFVYSDNLDVYSRAALVEIITTSMRPP